MTRSSSVSTLAVRHELAGEGPSWSRLARIPHLVVRHCAAVQLLQRRAVFVARSFRTIAYSTPSVRYESTE